MHVDKPTGLATEREVYEVLGEAWAHLNEWHWDADVRWRATWGQGQLGHTTPEVIVELYETLEKAANPEMRCEAARLLGQISQGDSATIELLWSSLLDENDAIQSACALALVRLGKRNTQMKSLIEKRLVQAIQDPQFDKPDRSRGRPAYDVAYEGLWLLLVSQFREHGFSTYRCGRIVLLVYFTVIRARKPLCFNQGMRVPFLL